MIYIRVCVCVLFDDGRDDLREVVVIYGLAADISIWGDSGLGGC